MRFLAVIVLTLALDLAPAAAQERGGGGALRLPRKQGIAKKGPGASVLRHRMEALERMTPEQQERFLNTLPPPRRAEAKRLLGKWRDMTPVERQRARRSLDDFRELPGDRQQRVRSLFGQFNQMPAERRPLLRAELRHLRKLDGDAARSRMNSEDFRTKYSESERQLLGDLVDSMPPLEEE